MLSRAAGGLGHALAWARNAARNFWTFLGGSRLMVTLPRSRVVSCADPSTQAPSLCGRYPLPRYYGPVRLPPRPVLSLAGFLVDDSWPPPGWVSRVASVLLADMPSPLPRRTRETPWLFRLILAQAWGLGSPRRRPSLLDRKVGVRELCFEACSAFTVVTACLLAESP